MRVHALLSWFDESPRFLEECVHSLYGVADRLVALDGGYELFPGAQACSPDEQEAAIRKAAYDIDLPLDLYQPGNVWRRGEVEKRAALFSLAEDGTDPEDWYFVIDADETVVHADIGPLRDTVHDVGQVALLGLAMEGVWKAQVGDEEIPSVTQGRLVSRVRRFFRCIPGLTVEGMHCSYVTPDRRFLWGWEDQEQGLVDLDFLMDHRTHQRDKGRLDRALTYYRLRDEAGIERRAA